LTGGVDLGGDPVLRPEESFYALNNATASAVTNKGGAAGQVRFAYGDGNSNLGASTAVSALTSAEIAILDADPDILATGTTNLLAVRLAAASVDTVFPNLNRDNLIALSWTWDGDAAALIVRRLTHFNSAGDLVFIMAKVGGVVITTPGNADVSACTYNSADNFAQADAIGGVKGAIPWALEADSELNEIDIKVDSVAVTAMTRKLKAKWSPELAQDLNAYHNLDAEVELTSILSEQIALEIDREILKDLVEGATAGTLFWSRSPGKFVDRESGSPLVLGTNYPDFTGTVSEWYETLLETVNDVSARIHRKTLRGGANFLVCGPEVASILEFTSGFRASTSVDSDTAGSWGAQNVGSISRKMDIHVDPYFPRATILVGRRGGSFLESGYVYAPYVPLQVTPTIFGVEDFVPRKGVMTRYAKKMVRPDMYGLVICKDLVRDLADV
jgi:hypothetical protein